MAGESDGHLQQLLPAPAVKRRRQWLCRSPYSSSSSSSRPRLLLVAVLLAASPLRCKAGHEAAAEPRLATPSSGAAESPAPAPPTPAPPPPPPPSHHLKVSYGTSLQPTVNINVGGQQLRLVFDASSGNTILFVKENHSCIPETLPWCYSADMAMARDSLKICKENKENIQCNGSSHAYPCSGDYLDSLNSSLGEHDDGLIIDGLTYEFASMVEAKEDVVLQMVGKQSYDFNQSEVPVRLLVKPMVVPALEEGQLPSVRLFEGVSGILGASGPSLSCRNDTLWSMMLRREKASKFAFDLLSPPNVSIGAADKGESLISLGDELDPRYAGSLIWSQPKQTGDVMNDGCHEFLMYHLKVCGVDMLYNTSSNWLTLVDTSGPCLTLPPFLFNRLITRIPVHCPFKPGEAAKGRLCSPVRETGEDGERQLLPTLEFQLEDTQDPEPPQLLLPLERLVFRNGSGQELLCISRNDTELRPLTADMMYEHIAFGSMAVAAFYVVVNLENHTLGFAQKVNAAKEGSNETCMPSVECVSPMQTYYPPLNLCEDPECSSYMFMTLDEKTKMCAWSRAVPVTFGVVLAVLGVLDLISHRLYKQAIEYCSHTA